MHIKKLLLALVGLGFILAFNTSCENDRDREEQTPTLEMSDLTKTYSAKHLLIDAQEAPENASVVVMVGDNNEATFKLINLITGMPEVIFKTSLEKKENGTYSFNYEGEALTEEEDRGAKYKLSGSFVGSPESGVSLVAIKEDFFFVYLTWDEMFSKMMSTRSYSKNILFINGKPATNLAGTLQPSVTLNRKDANDPNTVSSYTNGIEFGSGYITNHKIVFSKGDKGNQIKIERSPGDSKNNTTLAIAGYIEFSLDGNSSIMYLDTEFSVKSNCLGKWSMNLTDPRQADVNVKITTANEKNEEYSTAIQSFLRKSIPATINTIDLDFKDTGRVDMIFKVNGKDQKFPTGLNFYSPNDTSLKLGIDDENREELKEILNGTSLEVDDFINMCTTGAVGAVSRCRVLDIKLSAESSDDIYRFALSNKVASQGLAKILTKSVPSTEKEFVDKYGFSISESELKTLHEIFIHIADKGADVSLGFKKVQ